MPVDGRELDRGLVAKGDGERLLKVGPARHRGIAVLPRQVCEAIAQLLKIAVDDIKRGSKLEHIGGVHDVLRRGPPMHVTPRLTGSFRKLMGKRQNRVTDDLSFSP